MRFRKTAIAGAILVATTAGIATAQVVDAPTNPNISAAVQRIEAAIGLLRTDLGTAFTQLNQTLNSIQAALKGLVPPAASNVRVTAPVIAFPGQTIRCAAINLAATPKTINVELLGNGTIVPGGGGGGVSQYSYVIASAVVTGSIETPYSCRFTVADGTKADITASLTQINEQATAVVAVIAAE